MKENNPLTNEQLMEYMKAITQQYGKYIDYTDGYNSYTWDEDVNEKSTSSKEDKAFTADLINCQIKIKEFLKLNGYESLHTNLFNEDNHKLVINRFYFVANKKTAFRHYFDDIAKHDKWLVEYLSPICVKWKILNIHFQSGNTGDITTNNVIL